jgi:hypothetical protein
MTPAIVAHAAANPINVVRDMRNSLNRYGSGRQIVRPDETSAEEIVSVFARTGSGTALLFLKCTGLDRSIHPSGWRKYSGTSPDGIASRPTVLRMLQLGTKCQDRSQTIFKTDFCIFKTDFWYANRVVLRRPAPATAVGSFLPPSLFPQQRLASQSRLSTGNVGLVSRPGDFVGTDTAGRECVS